MRKISVIKRTVDAILLRIGKLCHDMRDRYYQHKNIDRPKLLVFTDSRGYEVTQAWNRKSAYASYVGKLCKYYQVDYVICPEFSTTVVDFLYEYQQRKDNGKHYDAVIAHVGVVDFSPRPTSMLDDMMKEKSHKISTLFGDVKITELMQYHKNAFKDLYFGKTVKNFYAQSFLKKQILPKLQAIDNLIVIGCSPVLTDWRGNYWRDRPNDMNMIIDYCSEYKVALANYIDMSELTREEIMEYTIDNIHLSQSGFNYVYHLIKVKLDVLLLQ
jgi:hypothetical protein